MHTPGILALHPFFSGQSFPQNSSCSSCFLWFLLKPNVKHATRKIVPKNHIVFMLTVEYFALKQTNKQSSQIIGQLTYSCHY